MQGEPVSGSNYCKNCELSVIDDPMTDGICGYCREEDSNRCAACGDLPDYCLGHGEIGDPAGFAVLQADSEDF